MTTAEHERAWTAVSTGKAAPPAGSYSLGAVAGSLVFTAGCGPHEPGTRNIVGTTIAEQTRQTLRNLAAILEESGTSLQNVVKVTTHLGNRARDFAAYDAVFKEFFSAPYPTRTTVGSDIGSILVEIDVVAVLPR